MFLEILDLLTQLSGLRIERVERLCGALSGRETPTWKTPRGVEVVDIVEVLSEGLANAEDFVQLEGDRGDGLRHGVAGVFGIDQFEPKTLRERHVDVEHIGERGFEVLREAAEAGRQSLLHANNDL